jgi:hypothetical protein
MIDSFDTLKTLDKSGFPLANTANRKSGSTEPVAAFFVFSSFTLPENSNVARSVLCAKISITLCIK